MAYLISFMPGWTIGFPLGAMLGRKVLREGLSFRLCLQPASPIPIKIEERDLNFEKDGKFAASNFSV
jgi:hypothetical protein